MSRTCSRELLILLSGSGFVQSDVEPASPVSVLTGRECFGAPHKRAACEHLVPSSLGHMWQAWQVPSVLALGIVSVFRTPPHLWSIL